MPPKCVKLFTTRIFPKHRNVPLRFFLVQGDKKFPTEKGDTPILIHDFFSKQKFSESQVPPLRKFLELWDQNVR